MRITDAIDKMLIRIESTAKTIKEDEFPIYADVNSGKWYTSSDGYWSDGFWVGLLWLAYYRTGEEKFLKWAENWLDKLRNRIMLPTVFRGFIFYYGAAIADILFNHDTARRIAVEGGKNLAKQYDSKLKIIPLNKLEIAFLNSISINEVNFVETNIDGVIASTLLAYTSKITGEESLMEIAENHAIQHVTFCINKDGSVTQSVRLDNEGRVIKRFNHMGLNESSIWARGQAWAMLNYALLSFYDREFLSVSRLTSEWWIKNVPKDYIAYWDFNDKTIKDTSATAIAASSLLKLSYWEFAKNTIESLVENYLINSKIPGALTNGCYFKKRELGVNSELIWGDYFLFESLLKLEGKLDKFI